MKLKKLLAAVVSGALALSTMAVSSFSVSAADNEWTKNADGSYSYTCVKTEADTDEWNGTPHNLENVSFADYIPADKTVADIRSITVTITNTKGNCGGSIGTTLKLTEDPGYKWEQVTYTLGTPTVIECPDGLVADATLKIGVDWINYDTDLTAKIDVKVESETPVDPVQKTVKLDKETLSLKVGETGNLTATTDPAGETVTWTSTDEKVATVKDGVVTPVAAGKCEIRANLDEKNFAFCVVTVTDSDTPVDPTPDDPVTEGNKWIKNADGSFYYKCVKTAEDTDENNGTPNSLKIGDFTDYPEFIPAGKKIADIRKIKVDISSKNGSLGGAVTAGLQTNEDPWYEYKQVNHSGNDSIVIEAPYGLVNELGVRVDWINYNAEVTVKFDIEFLGDDKPVEPDDPKPVDPTPAGSAVLWEGTLDLGTDWSKSTTIDAEKFVNLKAGDTLKFTYTNGNAEYFQFKIVANYNEWKDPLSSVTTNQYGAVELSGSPYSFVINDADTALLKEHGMGIGGYGAILTKVELITAGGNTPVNPDDPKPNDPKPDDPKPDDPKPDDPKPDDPHTHTAGTEWKTDASSHWHVCTGCSEVMDKVAHTFDGGTVTTAATATSTGVMTYKCTVCGFTKTETIPATGVDIPSYDPDYHPAYIGPVVIPANSPINSGKPTTSDGKAGWDAISEQVTTTGENAVKVDMNGETRLPKAIVSDISGKDVDLVLNMGRGITWTINGLSVTSPRMVDLSVAMNARTDIPDEAIDAIDGFGKKTISLDHNGSFGFTATMTISLGTRRNGNYANLFYYNPKTKELEFMDSDLIEGGKADLVFSHASDYLLVLSEEPLGEYEDVSSAAGVTASDDVIVAETSSAAYVIVLATAAVAGGFVVYKKRTRN